MKIAFYKAKYGDWKDRLISWATWGPYSHCELVFRDGTGFSSSPRDGGTRLKKIDWNSGHWDFFNNFFVSGSKEDRIRVYCESITGIPYDWVGVLCPYGLIHEPELWYCSEVIASIIIDWNIAEINTKQTNISPNQLWRRLRDGFNGV